MLRPQSTASVVGVIAVIAIEYVMVYVLVFVPCALVLVMLPPSIINPAKADTELASIGHTKHILLSTGTESFEFNGFQHIDAY